MELLTNQSYSDSHLIQARYTQMFLSIYYHTERSQEFAFGGSKTLST